MKRKLILAAAALHAIAFIAFIFSIKGETIPIHYNYRGDADQWGEKWFLLIFAFLPIATLGTHSLYRRLNQENRNIQENAKMEERVIDPVAGFLAALGWFFATQAANGSNRLNTSLACLIFTFLGLFIIYFSNFMPKVRPNRMLGYRIFWTLKDDTVWSKTHRIAGYTGVAGGLIIFVGSLIGMAGREWFAFAAFGLGMCVLLIPPFVYARRLYAQLHAKK